MKAKFVFEALEFERGMDPKEAMGIGDQYLNHQKIIQLVWPRHGPWMDDLIDNREYLESFLHRGVYNIIFIPYDDGKFRSISNMIFNPRMKGQPNWIDIEGKDTKESLKKAVIKKIDKWLDARGLEKATPFGVNQLTQEEFDPNDW